MHATNELDCSGTNTTREENHFWRQHARIHIRTPRIRSGKISTLRYVHPLQLMREPLANASAESTWVWQTHIDRGDVRRHLTIGCTSASISIRTPVAQDEQL